MSALSKQIEGEINKKNVTDVPSVNDDTILRATRYGIRIDYKASGDTHYVPPKVVTSGLAYQATKVRAQLAFVEEELRMYEAAESAIQHWQEQGEAE